MLKHFYYSKSSYKTHAFEITVFASSKFLVEVSKSANKCNESLSSGLNLSDF